MKKPEKNFFVYFYYKFYNKLNKITFKYYKNLDEKIFLINEINKYHKFYNT